MAPEDLKEYAGLTTTTILCRQRLTLSAAGPELIKWALEGTFGTVQVLSDANDGTPQEADQKVEDVTQEQADEEVKRPHDNTFVVMSAVSVIVRDGGEVEVEWEGNVNNDGIADAVLAVLLSVETSPAVVKRKSLAIPTMKRPMH